jgi:predicted metal-dependent HD superfamily phosphohydrolase
MVKTVSAYIMATKAHTSAESDAAAAVDSDLAHFLDFDLSVLSWPIADYDRYGRQIAVEYRHLAPDAYRTGRARVLRSMLMAGPKLYRTPALRAEWGQRAVYNLRRELAALEAAPAAAAPAPAPAAAATAAAPAAAAAALSAAGK